MPAVEPSPSRVGLNLSLSGRDFAMIRYCKETQLGTNSASRPMHRFGISEIAPELTGHGLLLSKCEAESGQSTN
jgi:hypothetical protein